MAINGNEKPVVESAQEARQGRWGYHVFVVLIVALLLAALAWVAVEIWGENIDDNATQSTTQAEVAVPPLRA